MKKLYTIVLGVILPFTVLAQGDPDISVEVSSLTSSLGPGSSETFSVMIQNTGGTQLDWSIDFANLFAPGHSVNFEKENFAVWTVPANQDRITDNVWITRGDNQSIFNARLENVADRDTSPLGTAWALGEVNALQSEAYVPFVEAHGGTPSSIIGQTLSLHLPQSDTYYQVEFSSFTGGGGGGGFAYQRTKMEKWMDVSQMTGSTAAGSTTELLVTLSAAGLADITTAGSIEINSNDPDEGTVSIATSLTVSAGPVVSLSASSFEVTLEAGQTASETLTIGNSGESVLAWTLKEEVIFTKENYADWNLPENQDRITHGVWLTRADAQGIFNYAQEGEYDKNSGRQAPAGTEWASGPTAFVNGNYTTWHGHYGNKPNLPGTTSSLRLVEEDLYYDIEWTDWSSGGGGSFGYIRTEAIPSWLNIDLAQGEINPEETTIVTIGFDAGGLQVGTYNFDLKLRSNDLNSPVIVIPIVLNVTGEGMISAQSSVDFGDVIIGTVGTYELGISNQGADALEISAMNSDNAEFTVNPASLIIPPFGYEEVSVRFRPAAAGTSTGTLSILSNDTGSPQFDIALSGNGMEPPTIELSSYAISQTLAGGDLATQTIEITNSGGSVLNVDLGLVGMVATDASGNPMVSPVSFEKPDFADPFDPYNWDILTDKVALSREIDGVLFNPFEEDGPSRNSSPEGTLWALGATGSTTTPYSNFRDLRDYIDGGLRNLAGHTVSLWLVEEDLYVDMTFQSWTCCENGGGFAYTRTSTFNYIHISDDYLSVEPGSTESFDITFDAAGALSGTYRTELRAETNVPLDPLLVADVELVVSSDATIALSALESSLDISVDAGNATTSSITLQNEGSRSIDWEISVTGELGTGETVYFAKEDYADYDLAENQDRISEGVWLTRGDYYPLYNAALHDGYNGYDPSNVWAPGPTDGSNNYTSFTDHTGNESSGNGLVRSGYLSSLYLTNEDRYFDVKWDYWTNNGNGGGFGYWRTERLPIISPTGDSNGTIEAGTQQTIDLIVNSDNLAAGVYTGEIVIRNSDPLNSQIEIPYTLTVNATGTDLALSVSSVDMTVESGSTASDFLDISNTGLDAYDVSISVEGGFILGESVTFTKENYACCEEATDYISENVAITRDESGWIYNTSFGDMLWAKGRTSEVSPGDYTDFEYHLGASEPGDNGNLSDLDDGDIISSLYLPDEGRYFDVEWRSWTCCSNGGGFSYTRTEVISWLDAETEGGKEFTISPEVSELVGVFVDAADLYAGEYSAVVNFHTSSLNTPELTLPVNVTVTGQANIYATAQDISFDEVFVDLANTEIVTISNEDGTADLIVNDVVSDSELLVPSETSFTIPPGQTYDLEVVLTPTTTGEHSGNITVSSNGLVALRAQGDYQITWSANVIGAPTADVSVNAIDLTVQGSETITQSVTITNNGDSDLYFTGDMQIPNGTVTFTKEDYADWTMPENQDRITDDLWITRKYNEGLFNIFSEDEYDNYYSPEGTLWMTGSSFDNFGSFNDYESWRDAIGRIGDNILDYDVISMRLLDNSAVYDFEFHSWTRNSNGGGFSYTRTEVPVWISVTAETNEFIVAPSESVTIDFEFSGNGLPSGVYLADILLETNAPGSEHITIPTSLTVVAQPELNVDESISFDDTSIGSTSSYEVYVYNSGAEPLTVTSISSDTPEFTVEFEAGTLEPFEEGYFNVYFTPSAEANFTGAITISSDDPDGDATISVSGNGILGGVLTVTPQEDFVDTTIPGGSVTKTYTLENAGVSTLEWDYGLESDDYFDGPIEIIGRIVQQGGSDWIQISASSESHLLEPGETVEVTVTMDASNLGAGVYNDVLYFYSSTSDVEVETIDLELTVVGTPEIIVMSTSLDFGNKGVGTTSKKKVIIENAGDGFLTISAIEVSGGSAFSVTGSSLVIDPYSQAEIEVLFSPAASQAFTDDLVLTHDDPVNTDPISITLTGSGVTPAALSVDVESISEVLFYGETVTKTVTITNTGEADLEWSFGANSVVEFAKEDWADWSLAENQDRVSADIWITRADERGIFNFARESGYNSIGERRVDIGDQFPTGSPEGTLWSWGPTTDTDNVVAEIGGCCRDRIRLDSEPRYYTNWNGHMPNGPIDLPGNVSSMWLPEENKFYDIEWTSWTSGEYPDSGMPGGGGFGYIRTEIFAVPDWMDFSETSGTVAGGASQTIEITLNPDGTYKGYYELLTQIAGNGGALDFSIDMEVNGIVDSGIDDRVENEGFVSTTINLNEAIVDAQGDALSFTVESSDLSVVTVTETDGILTISEVGVGSSDVLIMAEDGKGSSLISDFNFRVNAIPVVATEVDDQVQQVGFATTSVDISGVFSDADGDDLTMASSSGTESVVTVTQNEGSLTITEVGAGVSTITLTGDDGVGGSVTSSFDFRVNTAPTVVSPLSDQEVTKGIGSSAIDLSAVFDDADSDNTLTYSATTSNASIATASVSGADLSITGTGYGTATITVTAEDGFGGLVSDEADVSVTILGLGDDLKASFMLYPNPTTGNSIHLELDGNYRGTVALRVFDLNGSEVLTINRRKTEAVFNEQLNIDQLAPGNYILELETSEGTSSQRFVKQ